MNIKRLYYSISEVARLADEEQYVLRYWETEFEQLRPQKNRAGNRIYMPKDIEVIKTIKHLLRDKRYTIEGAKEILKDYRPDADDGNAENARNDENETVTENERTTANTGVFDNRDSFDNHNDAPPVRANDDVPAEDEHRRFVSSSPSLSLVAEPVMKPLVETVVERVASNTIIPFAKTETDTAKDDVMSTANVGVSHSLHNPNNLSREDLLALRDLLLHLADLLS